jgi:hypothetical protein
MLMELLIEMASQESYMLMLLPRGLSVMTMVRGPVQHRKFDLLYLLSLNWLLLALAKGSNYKYRGSCDVLHLSLTSITMTYNTLPVRILCCFLEATI